MSDRPWIGCSRRIGLDALSNARASVSRRQNGPGHPTHQPIKLGAFARSRPKFLDNSEETQLNSGWTLIGSELSSPNLNSSVRAERSFAIRYLNVVIKPLYGNLDICLNYLVNAYFQSRNSVCVLSVTDRDQKWNMVFWIALFSRVFGQFNRFRDRNGFRSRQTRARECTFHR